MKNKVIIFDLDGVLFDSIAISEQYFFDVYPGSTKEMVRDLLSGNYHDEIQKITIPKKQETDTEKISADKYTLRINQNLQCIQVPRNY